jgi:hypothetical protein
MGMLAREILGSDELSDLANAQVVGLYIHLRFFRWYRATTGEKKPPVPAVFVGCALFSQSNTARLPPEARFLK